jgi:hypothetical protein
LHKFCKERRRSPRGCFECDDTTHLIADCPKRKKLDSSNKYNYDSSDKSNDKKKYRRTTSGTRRRSSRRSCPECVLPSATLISPVMTPPAQRMRRSSVSQATSPAFAT